MVYFNETIIFKVPQRVQHFPEEGGGGQKC